MGISCKDTSTGTAIKIYHELFATFGTPNTIHSDKGSGCPSTTMRKYLRDMGINMSATTPQQWPPNPMTFPSFLFCLQACICVKGWLKLLLGTTTSMDSLFWQKTRQICRYLNILRHLLIRSKCVLRETLTYYRLIGFFLTDLPKMCGLYWNSIACNGHQKYK